MDSPGQRRGSCGHKMAGFDMHEKCARCRDKGLGKDPCIVGGAICKICDNFTAIQREMLATPQYQIRKDKKAGLLVSPRDVTVLSPVNYIPRRKSGIYWIQVRRAAAAAAAVEISLWTR